MLVASHNQGKIKEMIDLLGPFGFEVVSAGDLGLPEPDETGTTFEENAYIKAFAAAKATGLVALSDDLGLCVDALGGNPGVYTANWAELPDGKRDFAHGMRKVEKPNCRKVVPVHPGIAAAVSFRLFALPGPMAKPIIIAARWKARSSGRPAAPPDSATTRYSSRKATT